MTPHLDGVSKKGVFAATLFIFTVCAFEKPFRERMSMVPIEHPTERELSVGS